MSQRSKVIMLSITALLIIGGGFLASSILTPSAPEPAKNQITVSASIFPLANITGRIGGEHVEVVTIIPPGVTPHSYSPTPQQIASLVSSKTLFIIGHNLEPNALLSLAEGNNVPITVADKNIILKPFNEEHAEEDEEEEHGDIDPHYWLTVSNAQTIALTITQKLQEIDPDNTAAYQSNLNQYLQELSNLEIELQAIRNTVSNPSFIAIHNAWSYFADHYNLELVATYEPIEGQQPTPSDLQRLRQAIEDHAITSFFTEPQKQSSTATRLMQQEFGLNIQVIDPIGGIPPRDSYVRLMRANMQALR